MAIGVSNDPAMLLDKYKFRHNITSIATPTP